MPPYSLGTSVILGHFPFQPATLRDDVTIKGIYDEEDKEKVDESPPGKDGRHITVELRT
jgi:hypothetical protein